MNAAYASEFGFEHTERDQARTFVGRLLELDKDKRLHAVLFQQFFPASAGCLVQVGSERGGAGHHPLQAVAL